MRLPFVESSSSNSCQSFIGDCWLSSASNRANSYDQNVWPFRWIKKKFSISKQLLEGWSRLRPRRLWRISSRYIDFLTLWKPKVRLEAAQNGNESSPWPEISVAARYWWNLIPYRGQIFPQASLIHSSGPIHFQPRGFHVIPTSIAKKQRYA